jgi:peptidoglycan/xylan/chitin deacetylase (PgdA/CDA1 family)
MSSVSEPTPKSFLLPEDAFDEFFVVVAAKGDTLQALADKYLQDPDKGWVIGKINDINQVTPGADVIIPKRPFFRGGIESDGYQTVPVLVYHKFSKDKADKMTVLEANFREQMQFLKDNGYKVITLDELYEFLEYREELPEKSVAVTIDDGWCSFYEIAYPILRDLGLPATLFVYDDLIHAKKCLTWEQLGEMAANGISMQNHTKEHRNWAKMKKDETLKQYYLDIKRQFDHTHAAIQAKIGSEPRYIAYPYGKTGNLFLSHMGISGYRLGFTVKRGSAPFFTNNYLINRSVIYGEYDLQKFRKNLKTKEAMQ